MLRSGGNFHNNRTDSGLSCPEPTLAQQQYKEQANITNIVNKYLKTGLVNMNTSPPLPDEFTAITDFHTAMNIVKRGEQAFNELPSQIRNEFENDAGAFLNALHNPANKEKFQKLGILNTPIEPPTEQSSPAPEPAAQ